MFFSFCCGTPTGAVVSVAGGAVVVVVVVAGGGGGGGGGRGTDGGRFCRRGEFAELLVQIDDVRWC